MAQKIRLALIAGGKSGEREVSLAGAKGVLEALDPEKYHVHQYDPAHDLPQLTADAPNLDVAFILLHGPLGEDGAMQGLLDLLGLPYQGSGILGSAVAMNKNFSKMLYKQAGLPLAEWVMASKEDINNPANISGKLQFPLVIKPVSQGSSLGMSIAHSDNELATGLQQAFKYDQEVMVEEFLQGREITGGVIGNETLESLPLVEIIPGPDHPFFDYEAKYQTGASQEICPADLPDEITRQAQEYAIKAHQVLHLQGYSRTDMIVAEDGKISVIETNTIPGMTPTSLLPQAAQAAGYNFPQLLDQLISLAMGHS